MGFRVALIAIRGKTRERLYGEYGVRATGEREEIAESPICGATVSTGWQLLYLNDHPRPHSELLAVLSNDAELIFCDVNETTGTSFATAWSHGKEEWGVFHDSQQSLTHLVTFGTMPDAYSPILAAKLQEQEADRDDVDYIFDVPVELFASITGIRYDTDLPGAAAAPFETLRVVPQMA